MRADRDWRTTARAIVDDLATLENVGFVSPLTLLRLMVGPVGRWYVRPAVLLLCAAGLLLPRVARLPSLWIWLAWLTALRVLGGWPQVDNHAFLLSYWCLALAIAHGLPDARGVLALNGRVLLGLVFALATLQKAVLSPDYLDGRFFRFTLVTDPRFESITRLVGRMDAPTLAANRDFLLRDRHGPRAEGARLAEPAAFRTLVTVSTWATLILEALVALAFRSSRPMRLYRARDGLLITFCASTDAVAPVPGSGWLLVVMGLAQGDCGRSAGEARRVRLGYLAAWTLILVHEYVPWATLVLEWTAND